MIVLYVLDRIRVCHGRGQYEVSLLSSVLFLLFAEKKRREDVERQSRLDWGEAIGGGGSGDGRLCRVYWAYAEAFSCLLISTTALDLDRFEVPGGVWELQFRVYDGFFWLNRWWMWKLRFRGGFWWPWKGS